MDKGFLKKLLSIVFPIAFQQFMLALVSASDAFMLGFLNQESLSAVSLASQVTFVENLFLAAMTIGLSTIAAQYWGKKDVNSVEKIFAYVMKITFFIALIFMMAGLFMPHQLMHIFTSDTVLIGLGAKYLRTVALSFLLTGISQIYLCLLKNTGKAFLVAAISSLSVIINIILNSVFIFGMGFFPKMEITGAAAATAIAKIIELILCIVITARGRIQLKWQYFFEKITELKRGFWKSTGPVLGNEITWGIGFTMYSVIMGHLGNDAVAANSMANIVKNLVVCFCIGIGSGGGIIVGNELGAGHLTNARELGKKLCHMAIVCGLISGAIMLALTPVVLEVTNLSDNASYYLRWMFVMCAAYMVGKSVNVTTISGIFSAGGDTGFGFLCDTITMWCITVPLGFISAFLLKWPVLVTYLIINMDEVIKLPAVYRHYKKYNWVKNLTQKEEK